MTKKGQKTSPISRVERRPRNPRVSPRPGLVDAPRGRPRKVLHGLVEVDRLAGRLIFFVCLEKGEEV